ncbi:hypothetical protein MalM14_50160 [Gimesia chilikensis]|nr:hypothetical protein MalM14_50160 [Gimesia chilikensis]
MRQVAAHYLESSSQHYCRCAIQSSNKNIACLESCTVGYCRDRKGLVNVTQERDNQQITVRG